MSGPDSGPNGNCAGGTDRYEIVITPRDGCEKEHADLLRKRLLADGFYEDVVEVRKVETGTDRQEGSQ